MDVQVRHRDELGRERLASAGALRGRPVEEWPALREQRPYRGRKSKVVHWWSSTTKKNIACGSQELKYAAMFLDRDPDIAYLSAPSLELEWHEGSRSGVVQPAFVARTADGQRVVYLHRRDAETGKKREVAVARAAADEAGWLIDTVHAPGGQLRENVSLVAQFRHDEYADADAQALLLEAFAQPRPVYEADQVGLPPGQGRARCWHLLWTGALTTNWEQPLIPTSVVWASGDTP